MKKKILVTGGTGVIGYNLINRIKSTCPGDEITSLSSKGRDITEYDECKFIGDSRHKKFDIIYHLAGYGQPQKFINNPKLTYKLNTIAVQNLIDLKLKSGGIFIFASTSELYGDCKYGNTESSPILLDNTNIRNCYSGGKLFGEDILRYSGINSIVLRICLAYGPGFQLNDTRVINQLIHKALTTGCINLMDEGLAVRNYIYIDDAIDMLFKILDRKEKGFQLYNIGGKQPVRIIDLANIIGRLTGATVIPGPSNGTLVGSPEFAGVNIDKFESEFGEQVFVDIETGIRNCIEWYRSIL